uniref:Galectin n=1 Tax=Stomoxys calcitrans TaxID=35570 RepID=A0A1I8P044_STOCA
MEELVTEFKGILAEPLQNGHYFDIVVEPTKHFKKFCIHFSKDKTANADSNTLCFSTVTSGPRKFIPSHPYSYYNSDSEPRDAYRIIISVHDTDFHVSLSEKLKVHIGHTNLIQHVRIIQIEGDIKLINRVDHRKIYPMVWPPSASIPHSPNEMFSSNDIPIPFKPGHLMVLGGRCFGNPQGNFYINLKHAHNGANMMHFCVDFRSKLVYRSDWNPSDNGQNTLTRAAKDCAGGFPFDFIRPFKMAIACKHSEFAIAVDGHYFCSYAYRDPRDLPRPYTNALSNIVGPKIFGRDELGIKITGIDHIILRDAECTGFETYTKEECPLTNTLRKTIN